MNKQTVKQKITDYYNTNKEYYDKLDLVFRDRGDEAFRRGSFDIIELAKQAECILDAGCGSGALLSLLRDQYPSKQYFGVDISPLAIEKANEKNIGRDPQITFQVQDIEDSVPYGREMFDLVIAHEMIEHVTQPESVIRNIAASLKRGGFFFLLAPNRFIHSSFSVQSKKIIDFAAMMLNRSYLRPTIIDPPLDVVGGDSDAVYVANPWELHRMVHNAGMRLMKKSHLKCRFIAVKP